MVEKDTMEIAVETTSVLKDIPEKDLSSISNCCGAYVIKVQSGKRYVGSSKTLRTRIQSHKVHNDPNVTEPIISVCCYLTKSHMEARVLENWLIKEVNPELNRTSEIGVMKSGRVSKCDHDCKTWDTPGRYVKLQVKCPSILNDVSIKDISSIPAGPGVYVLTTNSGKRYVGSSKAVRKRVMSHNYKKDANPIEEPFKSVCCFLTEDEMDAPILEYWFVSELKPELNRENQPDASTWKKGSKEKLLSRTEDELREVFNQLSLRISRLPNVKKVARKNWITYQTSALKNFCAIRFMSGYLQINLKDYEDRITDDTQFCRKINPTQAWTFHRQLELHNLTQMDRAFELIQQAYNEMMK